MPVEINLSELQEGSNELLEAAATLGAASMSVLTLIKEAKHPKYKEYEVKATLANEPFDISRSRIAQIDKEILEQAFKDAPDLFLKAVEQNPFAILYLDIPDLEP